MILPSKMSRKLWDSIRKDDVLVHTVHHIAFKVVEVERYCKNDNGVPRETVFEITNDKGETLRYNDDITQLMHLDLSGEQ